MKLHPGTQLRHYRIVEPIGAGGMGEVYRARDTNLDRDVAIKVLPQSLASNPMSLARLEREAKAIAALSHPNILAVYDFSTEHGTAFLVTELLQGETLRERLDQGVMAPRKAAEIGRQISRGLAAAHDKGIVHRDLKPDNLFLTEDGRVKILDFGLATAEDETEIPAAGDMDGATRTSLTAPGTVLGTVDYMSPEQVRGEPTDNRSDLFSFGSVLYETIGGARPFHRETQAETMTAILREEPADLATLSPEVPPALANITRRCMEKRPGERFHSAHDLAFSLEALSGSSASTGTAAAMAGISAPWRRPGLAVTAALLLIGLVIGAVTVALLQRNNGPVQAVSFDRLSSRRGTVTNGRFVGSDGKAIYSASWEGGPLRLYPATPGSRISDPLGIEDADLLSVSADGKLALALNRRYPVGWEAMGTLAIATPGGAAPRQILEDVLVADWGPDGESLAVAHEVDGVVQLEYPIGTVLYQSPGWISDLRVHPDGDRILIADCPGRGDNTAAVRIVDTNGNVETVAPRGGSWGVLWAPDGETVLASTGPGLFRVRPGETPDRIYGSSIVIRLLDIDVDGRLLVSPAMIRRELIVKSPDSDTEADLSWLDWSTPSILSRDGHRVLFEEGNELGPGGYGLYMRETDGSPPLHLGYGSSLALSPDGDQVAVVERQFRDDAGLVLLPTGLGKPVNIELGGLRILFNAGAWLEGSGNDDPDTLILSGRIDDGVARIYRLPLSGGGPPEPITPSDLPLAPQGHIVSLDGLRLIVNPADGPVVEFSMDGSGTRPVPGIEPDDLPLSFHRDGRHIFVQAARAAPAPIFMVDTVSGERTLWQELSPRDRAGVSVVDRVLFSSDGDAYAYSIRRMISGLSMLDGLQP